MLAHARQRVGRPAIVVAFAGAGIAAGVLTVHIVRAAPEYSFAGASTGGAVVLLVTGWALIAAGLAFTTRRRPSRFGPLLIGAGFAWFLMQWNSPSAGSALGFTIGLCLYAACPALVGHAVLTYPGGSLRSKLERIAVLFAYVGAVLVLGVLPALLSDPRARGCACPRNLVLVSDRSREASDLTRVGLYLGITWAFALALLAFARLIRATRAGWGPSWPVFAAGAIYLGLVGATFVLSIPRGILWNGTLERRLWIGEAGALVGMAAALGWSVLRVPQARSAVARLVVDLGQSSAPGGLGDILSAIVDDPELVIAYPVGEAGGLVDARGHHATIGGYLERTNLVRDGDTIAVLAHAPGVLDDRHLVDELIAAARLALENERLQAAVAVRIEQLRASRARIVAAGDTERKRLERDLHDGAQQRLVALSLSLRLLQQRLADGTEPSALAKLDEAEANLERAISELRELAHGIFPAVLADGGLAVAVEALAEDGPIPITLGRLPGGRFPPAVETAAYSVVAEVVRTADGPLHVRGARHGTMLVVEIEERGGSALDLVPLEDRVGALDGSLRVEHRTDGRVTIRAELPCES